MRRRAVLGAPAALLLAAASPAEDGLFHEPWFLDSFLDLADDQAESARAGRRLAVLWELRGCPFCRQMHETTLSDPTVVQAIRARMDVVLLDIIGARPVTAPGLAAMPEKALARQWGVRGTPTILVLPGAALPEARLEGYATPAETMAFVTALPKPLA